MTAGDFLCAPAYAAAGQMWTRQGKIGGALELDGDDYVDIADYNPNGADFSIGAWVTLTATGSDYYPIFGNNQNTPMLGYDPELYAQQRGFIGAGQGLRKLLAGAY